jgi:hypothetical protein
LDFRSGRIISSCGVKSNKDGPPTDDRDEAVREGGGMEAMEDEDEAEAVGESRSSSK